MKISSSKDMPVEPFIMVPIRIEESTLGMILGPDWSKDKAKQIHSNIIPKEIPTAKIVNCFSKFSDKWIAATVVHTNARDKNSGRLGLKLIYGAFFSKHILITHENPIYLLHSLYDKLFNQLRGTTEMDSYFDEFTSIFQGNKTEIDEFLKNIHINQFINDVCFLYKNNNEKKSILEKFKYFASSIKVKIKPKLNLSVDETSKILETWADIEESIINSKNRQKSPLSKNNISPMTLPDDSKQYLSNTSPDLLSALKDIEIFFNFENPSILFEKLMEKDKKTAEYLSTFWQCNANDSAEERHIQLQKKTKEQKRMFYVKYYRDNLRQIHEDIHSNLQRSMNIAMQDESTPPQDK